MSFARPLLVILPTKASWNGQEGKKMQVFKTEMIFAKAKAIILFAIV
jgi:hypothetical protein